jgi:hypothetical protein
MTADSIHSQLPSILDAVPPSKCKDMPCCGYRGPLTMDPYKTKDKIVVLYILLFRFEGRAQQVKSL